MSINGIHPEQKKINFRLRDFLILFFLIVYILGFLSNAYFISNINVIKKFDFDNGLISIFFINAGFAAEENIEITLSRPDLQMECTDILNLTYSTCNVTKTSRLQYILACSELPIKGAVFVNCNSTNTNFIMDIIYNSESHVSQLQYECYSNNNCTNKVNNTEIKYGYIISRSLIPFLPFVK